MKTFTNIKLQKVAGNAAAGVFYLTIGQESIKSKQLFYTRFRENCLTENTVTNQVNTAMIFSLLYNNESSITKNAQQSVHLTLGSLRTSQAVFYALSFFQLDGFAVPTPAQVTQTVRRLRKK